MQVRVLIVRGDCLEFVCGADGRLPSVDVPAGARLAWHLAHVVRDRSGLDVLCLAIDSRLIAWMEAVEPDPVLPPDWHWSSRNALADREIADAIDELDSYRLGRRSGPFARVGWLRDFYARAEPCLPRGTRFSARFEQWNPGPHFSLIRFDLEPHGAVWLKAVGEPVLREQALLPALAARHPRLLPPVLASMPEWNALLLEHVDMPSLAAGFDRDGWLCAAAALATLQIDWHDDVPALVELGCADCRLERLDDFIDPFFEAMGPICEGQVSARAARLDHTDLRRIARAAHIALARLAELGVPESLGHGDLGPQNVLHRAGRVVFLDWASGCVGHPFLTFDAFRHRFVRECGTGRDDGDDVADAYASVWRRTWSRSVVDEALRVAPVVAPLQCAFLCATETGALCLDERRYPLYRSLVRLIRDAQTSAELEVCR